MSPRTDPSSVVRAQRVLEEHDVAADGSFAVVSRREVAGNRYVSHLWLVPLRGAGPARRLTDGATRDTRPRIAPDGRRVAFRRAASPDPRRGSGPRAGDDDETSRLVVLPLRPTGANQDLAPTTSPSLTNTTRRIASVGGTASGGPHIAVLAATSAWITPTGTPRAVTAIATGPQAVAVVWSTNTNLYAQLICLP